MKTLWRNMRIVICGWLLRVALTVAPDGHPRTTRLARAMFFWAKPISDYEDCLTHLVSYVITARLTNQPEWMDGLADEVNRACLSIGESDRFVFDGDGLRKV